MPSRRSFLVGGLGAVSGLWASGSRLWPAAIAQSREPVSIIDAQSAILDVPLRLVPNRDRLGREVVNFGVPLPPGFMSDPMLVSVLDRDGREIECAVRPLEQWRIGAGDAIRAVQVQCTVELSSRQETPLTIRFGPRRLRNRESFVPIEDTLNDRDGRKGPRSLAVLPAEWLCASQVAGPQAPRSQSAALAIYDQTVEKNFAGSLEFVDSTDATHWLFDRTSCWYKAYVRTGDAKYLSAAYRAANYVRSETVLTGANAGTFRPRGVDLKYIYPRAMHLHYLLSGDPRALETGKVMARYCLDHWNPHYRLNQPSGPKDDSGEGGFWTPRHQGIAMSGVLHGWEMTGDPAYWTKAADYVDACEEQQSRPLDGRPPDGSWRLNWAAYDASEATFAGGASAWMTAMLCDSLFHHWTLSKDARIPKMLEAWSDFLDARGLQPDGTKAYYVINCFAGPGEAGGVVDENMDQHNAEIAHSFALGAFFTADPAKQAAYRRRIDRLLSEWSRIDLNSPPRAYNWALQASSQLIYLLQHTPDDLR